MSNLPSPPTPLPQGEGSNPLDNLRDIHLPQPIDWWPLAPGWWIIATFIIASIVALSIWLHRRARQRRYRKIAAKQLRAIYRHWQQQRDDLAFAQSINRLLKQTALAAFPASDVAALNGADWLDFLDRHLRKPRFTEPDVRALATLYLREPEPIAIKALHDATQHWIRSHRC